MMKLFLLLWLACTSVLSAAVDLGKPIAELKLKDGRMLKNVEIVSYASGSVMAKWDGGRGTIAYDAFPSEIRAEAEKMRPIPKPTASAPVAPKVVSQSKPAPLPAGAQTHSVTGQVFITTRGAGAYKFAGATVSAYPAEIFDQVYSSERANLPLDFRRRSGARQDFAMVEAWQKALESEARLAFTETDADGKFKLTVEKGRAFFLVCFTTRRVVSQTEVNAWLVVCDPSTEEINLNSGNEWKQPD